MNTKKIKLLTTICCGLCAAFSLTTISFHGDVSLAAFPLSLGFAAALYFVSLKKLFEQNNLFFILVLKEFLQYLPYVLLISFVFRRAGNEGTAFVLDAVSVLIWFAVSAVSIVILHFLNPKKIGKVSAEWKKYVDLQKEKSVSSKSVAKKSLMEFLSWVDALVQAVFMVLLLNVFIVQLYEIPSESMVPEFLIKDRVVVFKTLSGPKFPLSEIGLPYFRKYDRGDIVVFRNPHYSSDRKSEVKTFLSQLVYMCTLTKVNLNVEADGNPKADPLVKRVCGVGGEQLMMQDGILYSRTAASPEFKPVQDDSKWAAWNVNGVSGVQMVPLSDDEYDSMLKFEELRRNFSIDEARVECKKVSEEFKTLYAGYANKTEMSFSADDKAMNELQLFSRNEALTAQLLGALNGAEWFEAFMTDWCRNEIDFAGDLYREANYKLNLMIKLTLGKLVARNARLIVTGAEQKSLFADSKKIELIKEAELEHMYVYLLDRRNMPVFPSNDENGNPVYIPENCYFMMGDNRFNSLDMRHSYENWTSKISADDRYSVTYVSDMKPQYINRSRMLGNTSFRFWPLNRAGKPGLTGK